MAKLYSGRGLSIKERSSGTADWREGGREVNC